MVINVQIQGLKKLQKKLKATEDIMRSLKPYWQLVGQYVQRKTIKERFDKEQTPDGQKWKPHSEMTKAMRLRRNQSGNMKIFAIAEDDERNRNQQKTYGKGLSSVPHVKDTFAKQNSKMSKRYMNSGLVVYKKLSPNHSGQRTHSIDRITPHCVVGQWSAEELGDWFAKSSIQASSNYGIDRDGRVALYVEEKNRSWCSSSNANDQRAVTIECASDTSEPYAFRDVVYRKLNTLCVDICKRNGKKKLI